MTQSIIYDASPPSTDGRFWAKRITKKMKLMAPDAIHGARDIPGRKLPFGPVELVPGDFLIEGEPANHQHLEYGWHYVLKYIGADGKLCFFVPEFDNCMNGSNRKPFAPRQLSECVRVIHELRMGKDAGVTPLKSSATCGTMYDFALSTSLKDAISVGYTDYNLWLNDNYGEQVQALQAQGIHLGFYRVPVEVVGEMNVTFALTIKKATANFCFRKSARGHPPEECHDLVSGAFERMPAMQEAFTQFETLNHGVDKCQQKDLPLFPNDFRRIASVALVDQEDWHLTTNVPTNGNENIWIEEMSSKTNDWLENSDCHTEINVTKLVTNWCRTEQYLNVLKNKEKLTALLQDADAFGEAMRAVDRSYFYPLPVEAQYGCDFAIRLLGVYNESGTPLLHAYIVMVPNENYCASLSMLEEESIDASESVAGFYVYSNGLDLFDVDKLPAHTFTSKELRTNDALMAFCFTSDFPLREALFTNGKCRDQIERFAVDLGTLLD
jgi:hypothetical protein